MNPNLKVRFLEGGLVIEGNGTGKVALALEILQLKDLGLSNSKIGELLGVKNAY